MAVDVYKNGTIQEDHWEYLLDEDPVPEHGQWIVPLERFLEDADAFKSDGLRLGVVIRAGEDVNRLAGLLDRLELVAVEFPSFADGRGFSAARLLAERYEFSGEIRAVGPFILDQIGFMQRCGINAFALDNPKLRKDLEAGNLNTVDVFTQPVGTRQEAPAGTRPWIRRIAT
ncbi:MULTISPECIES: DUF934 domain-containing protein [Pseudovibrio]|uniref:DUF934 domain-containing protein n=1 Tax=Stappiaceae TaxID=2821832 RepID=UPI00236687D7|nr:MULTISPECIES: DUF934 domain-containing protein [Pseudovibrio]MDD7912105.1 DUF934 domain-containing protein [Pseudovibrio exalbescens]MDX5592455.1 DUF934 domain-containing protein [Pseudovibrio sp. SPO723]